MATPGFPVRDLEKPTPPRSEREPSIETEASRPESASEMPAREIVPSADARIPHVPQAAARIAPAQQDVFAEQIESVLASDLEELYARLPNDKKSAFKARGEETAVQVRAMLSATKIKVKKIYNLIVDWLRMLPNVNRFFLEQEAKIKTDRLLTLAEEERKRREQEIA